eukprot:s1976_g6.t1
MKGPGPRKPRLIAGRFSRAERIRQRSRIELEDAALTPKTLTRYYAALRKLLPFVEKACSEDSLDSWVCKWVRRMWKSGEPILTVGDGLSALHFYEPWTKRRIPHAWKLFSIWRRIEVPSRAPPLTWKLVESMAAYEWEHEHYEMATVLLLGFHCLLRKGELLSVTADDFSLGKRTGVCSLKDTKTGIRHNANEAISITHPLVLEIVRTLVEARLKNDLGAVPLWSRTPGQFRKRFRYLCHLMDLQKHSFRPYSLRRGGATEEFQRTKSMESALIRGRWESSRALGNHVRSCESLHENIERQLRDLQTARPKRDVLGRNIFHQEKLLAAESLYAEVKVQREQFATADAEAKEKTKKAEASTSKMKTLNEELRRYDQELHDLRTQRRDKESKAATLRSKANVPGFEDRKRQIQSDIDRNLEEAHELLACHRPIDACRILQKLPADELVKLKDHIVPLLKDWDQYVRSCAWETLQKLPQDELVKLKDHIVPLLKDLDQDVRRVACKTLQKLPQDELVKLKDHIVPLLKDLDQDVCRVACEILQKLPAGELVKLKDHIVPLLKDWDQDVRRVACKTLQKLPADELVKWTDHIVPLLKDWDQDVRSCAWETLQKLPQDELVKLKDHIVPLLKGWDQDVRRLGRKILQKLPADELVRLKDHILPLLKDLDQDVRSCAWETLQKLPQDELVKLKDHIVPPLKEDLKHDRKDVRRVACKILQKLPADELVKWKDHIVPLLKDWDQDVRSCAWETLQKLPQDELVKLRDHIVPPLKEDLKHDRKDVRRGAFALFGRLELTKDLISLVETLRPALLLHFAAEAGDWPACFLLIRCGFSLVEKDRDRRTPSEIAKKEGHLDLAERLKSDFLHTKGGSGMAIARALQDCSQIEAVKVNNFSYAIERACPVHDYLVSQKQEIKEATKKGLFISDWEEVRAVPHLVRLENVAPLHSADIKRSITPKSLVTHLLDCFGGYDVGSNNCHHTAMAAFNFCTDSRQLTSLPVNWLQSHVAKIGGFLGSDLANGKSASEPKYSDVIRHPYITGSKPTEWSSDGKSKPYLQEVDNGSEQYEKVRDFVMNFGGSEITGFEIQKIHRNENFGCYDKYVHHLKDKTAQHEYCWLFHGPGGRQGFQKIVVEGRGFDDDFRSMTFAAYGQGHHFSLDFRLADFFADGKSQHEPNETRRVLLCRVAAGKPFDAKRLFPYVPGNPTSGRSDSDWTKKMEEFNRSKPEGHDNSWIGDDRALIVGKGEMVYVDYVVEYTSSSLAGNPYLNPLMTEIRKIPRPTF